MSKLLKRMNPEVSVYRDRRFQGDDADWERALRTSTSLYIGNLSFFTREEQLYEVFSKVGHVERIVMGLDRNTKTPCGFAFVIYYTRAEAEAAVRYLNGTMLDDRPVRVDHDWGYMEGRQWGRGSSGGQVRDEFRMDFDPGRGGFGKVVAKEIEAVQQQGSGMSPMLPANKRQRTQGMENDFSSRPAGRTRDAENPRFNERRRRGSDDEDDR